MFLAGLVFTLIYRKSVPFDNGLLTEWQPYRGAGGRLVKRTNFIHNRCSVSLFLVVGGVRCLSD